MSDLRAIRTDIVGSLLRPRTVIEGRGRLDEGKIDAAAMRAIEDDAVRAAIAMSHAATSPSPPPRTAPCTQAMVGLLMLYSV